MWQSGKVTSNEWLMRPEPLWDSLWTYWSLLWTWLWGSLVHLLSTSGLSFTINYREILSKQFIYYIIFPWKLHFHSYRMMPQVLNYYEMCIAFPLSTFNLFSEPNPLIQILLSLLSHSLLSFYFEQESHQEIDHINIWIDFTQIFIS